MKPTKIFIDLDDVLNRFTMPALYHVGCPVRQLLYDDYRPEWGWNIVCAANHLHPKRTWTEGEFWNSLKYDFWVNVPESEECMFLIDSAKSLVGAKNVCILSSPTLDPQVAAAKVVWIQDHLPTWLHRQYLIGPRKWFCASPDALLIDDCLDNILDFRLNGGRAILVPRPWNYMHRTNTQVYIQDMLCDIFYGHHDGTRIPLDTQEAS